MHNFTMEQKERMLKIIALNTQEKDTDGWILSSEDLKRCYNEMLPKSKRLDIISTNDLVLSLTDDLRRNYYIEYEYTQMLDGAYKHCFTLMTYDEITRMLTEDNR